MIHFRGPDVAIESRFFCAIKMSAVSETRANPIVDMVRKASGPKSGAHFLTRISHRANIAALSKARLTVKAACELWAKSFAPMTTMPIADKTDAIIRADDGGCEAIARAKRATKITLDPIKGVTKETSPRWMAIKVNQDPIKNATPVMMG